MSIEWPAGIFLRRSRVYTVFDTAVCALDGPSEQFDVAPDGATLARIFPAVVHGIVIVDRQVSRGHRVGVRNAVLVLERLVICDEFVNPFSDLFASIFAYQRLVTAVAARKPTPFTGRSKRGSLI